MAVSWRQVALLAVLLGCSPAWAEPASRDTPATTDARQQRETLRKAIDELRRRQQRIRAEKGSVISELAALERQIGALARDLRALEHRQEALEERHRALLAERTRRQSSLERIRAELAALVRAAYLSGRQGRLRLFLNQEDPARLSRMLAYHDYLSRARSRKLREVEEALSGVARLTAEVEARQRELEALVERRQQERRRLEARNRERKQVLAQLDEQLEREGNRLQRMREDERRLARLMEEARAVLGELELPEQRPFGKRKGRLIWPLEGRLATTFGAEKIGNLRWDGVIIRAPEGREVKAVHSGRVAWADWLRGYGLLTIIDHGDGYMTLYGHNQSLFKEAGDWVSEGEVIGLAGRSGGQRKPGIYFGIRHRGKAVNPARWCRRKRGRKVG